MQHTFIPGSETAVLGSLIGTESELRRRTLQHSVDGDFDDISATTTTTTTTAETMSAHAAIRRRKKGWIHIGKWDISPFFVTGLIAGALAGVAAFAVLFWALSLGLGLALGVGIATFAGISLGALILHAIIFKLEERYKKEPAIDAHSAEMGREETELQTMDHSHDTLLEHQTELQVEHAETQQHKKAVSFAAFPYRLVVGGVIGGGLLGGAVFGALLAASVLELPIILAIGAAVFAGVALSFTLAAGITYLYRQNHLHHRANQEENHLHEGDLPDEMPSLSPQTLRSDQPPVNLTATTTTVTATTTETATATSTATKTATDTVDSEHPADDEHSADDEHPADDTATTTLTTNTNT